MSRRLLTAVAVAMLALSATTAHAQVGYGVAAGFSAPIGDFGNVADFGFQATGLVTISAPLAPIGLRVEGSFSEFNYATLALAPSGKVRILYATANAVFSSPGIAGPYLIGGAGFYNSKSVCDRCTASSSKVGFNGGGGFKIGVGGYSAFVEARYHYIPGANSPTNGGNSSSNTQFIPLSFGLTF
jgi:hypothetical protein